MPKAVDKTLKLTYPPGCKELGEELSKDELVKRLKILARTFQDMGQEEDNNYKELAIYLSSELFLEHPSKDVRLLVACCIADIFRIFAPEAPYTDGGQLKEIFLFLTQQLRGLGNPESPSFKRYFYLLENLAWVKSFNICLELDENQEIFAKLFKLMFDIIREEHSTKVKGFMLDMMTPLITEADAVSQEMLDVMLVNIVEPRKSDNKPAYNLAKDLIRRTDTALEPYIQTFFNNALMLGKMSQSEVSGKLYDLIYELNSIAPSLLLAVLPQLEFKLKSSDEKERMAVTKLLAMMFSDSGSDLALQHRALWNCFLGRFNDIEVDVRRTCVQSTQEFIIHHPELLEDISENLQQRQRDQEEHVRGDVIQAIVLAAKSELSNISDELLECLKERTLDKKTKIRKEALMGLSQVYKKYAQKSDPTEEEQKRMNWMRNKLLHAYYQNNMEDRIAVERILNIALVPYSLEPPDRMKRLYQLYGSVDENAVKALHEIFKIQMTFRNLIRSLLEIHQSKAPEKDQLVLSRLNQLSRNLPEPIKANDYMKRFNKLILEDARIRAALTKLVSVDCPCKKAEEYVRGVLKKTGNPVPQNYLYNNVKMVLERVAPVMIDSTAIKALMTFVEEAVRGLGEICDEVPDAIQNGMKLLLMLSHVYPGAFQSEDVFSQLITFAKDEDDFVADTTTQIFRNTGRNLESAFPNIFSSLVPVLTKMVKIGTPRQAKHALLCIATLCKNKDKIFENIFEHLKKNMDLEHPNFLTSLVAMGHMAQMCPDLFSASVKAIVSRFIVKDLLMEDRTKCRHTTESWIVEDSVSEETMAKVQAMKMMVRWLLGIKTNAANSGTSTLRLLYTMVLHEGDLMEKGRISKPEMARLRLQAGSSIVKLVQEQCYQDLITLDQFQTVAILLNDPCYEVRYQFAQKLHKGLLSLRLPLQYMSIFSLAASDPMKERRQQVKHFLIANINKRREYLRQHSSATAKVFSLLPDYVLPYTIHLLAHDPDLRSHNDVETLKNIKDCLWFIMEPLITKNDNYSYSFYRKLIENIKQTKDAQCPNSETANLKLYAVCDLALGLVMTKTTNFMLKDFPADPVLPAKLFTQPDQNYSNTMSYLPAELRVPAGKGKKNIPALGLPSQPVASCTDSSSPPRSGPQAPGARHGPTSPGSESSGSVDRDRRPGPRGSKKASRLSDGEEEREGRSTRASSVSSGRNSRLSSTSPNSKHSPRRDSAGKEDRPPVSSPQKKRRAVAASRDSRSSVQGKITDYISNPRTALSNKNTRGGGGGGDSPSKDSKRTSGQANSAKAKSKTAAASSPSKAASSKSRKKATEETFGRGGGRGRKRTLSSDSAQSEEEEEPVKKPKASPAKATTRRKVRNLSPDLGSETSSSTRSSSRKQSSAESSPVKRRGRSSAQDSEELPSSGSTSTESTPRKASTRGKAQKQAATRPNTRRAPALVNGTKRRKR